MEDATVSLWAIAVIAGPIILGGILAYGVWRNRKKRREAGGARPDL